MNEKLKEAIKILHDECESHLLSCDGCPFYYKDCHPCALSFEDGIPGDWGLDWDDESDDNDLSHRDKVFEHLENMDIVGRYFKRNISDGDFLFKVIYYTGKIYIVTAYLIVGEYCLKEVNGKIALNFWKSGDFVEIPEKEFLSKTSSCKDVFVTFWDEYGKPVHTKQQNK